MNILQGRDTYRQHQPTISYSHNCLSQDFIFTNETKDNIDMKTKGNNSELLRE